MRQILIYFLMLCTAALVMASCSGDVRHTDTRVTHFIQLSVKGDGVVYVDAGMPYTDEGCSAELAGEDVSDKVVVDNPVNTSEIGPYTVTYSATNADGFPAYATRQVYVGRGVTGTVATGSYRQNAAGTVTNWSDLDIVMLTDGSGLYWVSDLLGGYYDQRAGYGPAYAMPAYLQVNADGAVDIAGGGQVPGWGDAYSDFRDARLDPATNTISYCVVYANMEFHVILTLKYQDEDE